MALRALLVFLLASTCLDEQVRAGRVNNDSQVASLVEQSIEQQQALQNSSRQVKLTRRHAQQLHPRGYNTQPGHQHEHKSTIACEGSQLELACQTGKRIRMVRAIFGRFSLGICNELGHSNYSVQCASFRAFLIMENKCNTLTNCSVIVSKELFGDPCEGTSKYLEVQYSCDEEGATNAPQASGSSSIPSSTNANTNANPGLPPAPAPAAATAAASVNKANTMAAAPGQSPAHKSPQAAQTTTTSNGLDSEAPASFSVIPATAGRHCAGQASQRNLYWNATRAGQWARQPCPDGSSGMASWFCDADRLRFWPAQQADLSQCRTNWLAKIANQLEQMLEAPSKHYQSVELARQQNEQLLRVVLGDLALLVRSKEVFGEDLKRIDVMISQVIGQLRSYSALIGWSGQLGSGSPAAAAAAQGGLFGDLFNRVAQIVSGLFEFGQRGAWLELASQEQRQQLELRLLHHLRDSGALMAAAASTMAPTRLANVLANVIDVRQALEESDSNQLSFHLRQLWTGASANRLPMDELEETSWESPSEFKIQAPLLKELMANGITRLLVLDVKRPAYSLLLRHQLDLYSTSNQDSAFEQQASLGHQARPDWNWRVFGLFAILEGSSGDLLDSSSRQAQLQRRFNELLVQWPINVHFRLQLSGPVQQQQAGRQCFTLSDNNLEQAASTSSSSSNNNKCHTLASNATNHVCECDTFGFIQLGSSWSSSQVGHQQTLAAGQQIVPPSNSILADFAWPPSPPSLLAGAHQSAGAGSSPYELTPAAGDSSQAFINAKQPPASQATWPSAFVLLGLVLLLVTLAALVVSALLRAASSRARLSKKQHNFLSGADTPPIFGAHQPQQHLGHLSGPTTGPLAGAEHSLIGDHQHRGSLLNMPGQAGSACSAATSTTYKPGQQLYAAHLVGSDSQSALPFLSGERLRQLADQLNPIRWFRARAGSRAARRLNAIQHRLVVNSAQSGSPMSANSLTNASPVHLAYRSQQPHQNGYTTGMHAHHRLGQPAVINGALVAPGSQIASSSTSSYVSSSAYYEEIGPTSNMTKLHPSQLGSNQRTMVDPFKQRAAAWSPSTAATSSTGLTVGYSLEQNYSPAAMLGPAKLQPDLSQLQQSASGAAVASGAQQANNTNTTTTTRHYLFASPSAVSAYKSSIVDQQQLQHHQQQQQQHQCYQQQAKHQHAPARFM